MLSVRATKVLIVVVLIAISTTSSWKFQLPVLKWNRKQLIGIAAGAVISLGVSNSIVVSTVLADARLNAPTAVGTRVNSDPESLLRYGLPFDCKELRDIQESIESAKVNLKTRRIVFAKGDISNAKNALTKYTDKIIKAAPSNHVDSIRQKIKTLQDDFPAFEKSVDAEASAGSGSVQERKGLDEAFEAQHTLAKDLSALEELMVPDNFRRTIPPEFASLPQLHGRATVEVEFKKPDGSQFNVDGKLYDDIKMTLVLDGYNAPVTAGNLVDLINKKFYDKKPVTRSDGFVVQLGDADPTGTVHGYVPPGETEERIIPLELSFKGDPELLYSATSEDEGRGYAAANLPFQSYGALGMARNEFEPDSASTQFFMLLFESDLTPAGKNMLDGRYTCFGYATENADLLKGIKEGDIISSIKVTSGMDKFVPGKK